MDHPLEWLKLRQKVRDHSKSSMLPQKTKLVIICPRPHPLPLKWKWDMLPGGVNKYGIGLDPSSPSETNFIFWATLNFMNTP